MGKFKAYLGKLEIEVDGEKLELDVRLKDKQKILSLTSLKSEESVTKLTNVFLEILKRSYPEEPPEEQEAFLTKKLEKFLSEISIAFGWTTREEMNKVEKSFRKKEADSTGKA